VGGLSGAHCCDSRGEGGKGGEVVEAALSYGRVEGGTGAGTSERGGGRDGYSKSVEGMIGR
jgi:hypothetical protein